VRPESTLSEEELAMLIDRVEDQMLQAAANLDFELAAKLRDRLFTLRGDAPVEPAPEQTKRRRLKKPKH